ncbi:MAG: ERF family protein [Candidatus Dormibacteria bacterium]
MTEGLKVFSSIVAIQCELAKIGIAKNHNNKQQGYEFRGIDDIYFALCRLLAAHRLCIFPQVLGRSVIERQTKSGGALFDVVLDVQFDFVNSEDGSKFSARVIGEAMDSADKGTNKAMSAAYKYVCLLTFCIPTAGLMEDADATTYEVAAVDPERQGRIADWSSKLDECATLDELQAQWLRVPGNLRSAVAPAKDRGKVRLMEDVA